MKTEQKIFRKDLCEALGKSKRQIQRLVKNHKLPRPDFPAEPGRPGHGKGHAWKAETLLPFLSERDQEKVLAFLQKETTTESQAVACIPRGQVVLAREGNSSLSTVQHEVEIISVPRPHEHTGKERKRFAQRSEVLSLSGPDDSVKEKEKLVRLYKADHPDARVSVRSFLRWEAALRELGPEGLYDNYGGGIYSSVPDEIFERWKELYLVQQRPGAQVCRDLLEEQYPEVPSAAAFLGRLRKEMSPGDISLLRDGPKIHNRKFASYIDRDKEKLKPGHLLVLDHFQIDVLVRGRDGKDYFPWGTDCQDVASGKVLACALGGPPNAERIRLVICRAFLRFGLPRKILVDNGRDFKARMLTGGAKRFRPEMDVEETKSLMFQLGVKVIFASFFNAQTKPDERWHRTVKDRFSRLFRTFRGGNVQERPEELQAIIKTGPAISFDEFEERFAGWIEADFNNRISRGKGMNGRTPNEVFAQGNVARPIDENSLSLLLLKSSRPVKVGRNGVTHLDRVYSHEALLRIKGEEVLLRYDPGQMGRVWVYSMADAFICQARERERIPYDADEETLSGAVKQKRHDNKVVKDADQIKRDRSLQPDELKRYIAKQAREYGTDLSPDTLYPEKPLLRTLRAKVAEMDKEAEVEEDRRREASASRTAEIMATWMRRRRPGIKRKKFVWTARPSICARSFRSTGETGMEEKAPSEALAMIVNNTIQALKTYMQEKGASQVAVARDCGISPAVVSQLLKGEYKGNIERVCKQVRDFLSLEEQRETAFISPSFVLTQQASDALLVCAAAHKFRFIGLLEGGPGLGKTMSLMEYVRGHSGVVLVTASVWNCSRGAIANLLTRAVRVSVTYNGLADCVELINSKIGSGALIIFDESQHLSKELLEGIRNINDTARVGIVLSGTLQVSSRMADKRAGFGYAQIASRIGCRRTLSERVTREDVEKIVQQAISKPTPEILNFCFSKANLPGAFRTVTRYLQFVVSRAATRKEPVSLNDFHAAEAALMV